MDWGEEDIDRAHDVFEEHVWRQTGGRRAGQLAWIWARVEKYVQYQLPDS